jgi:hypothetical protein
VYTLTYFNGYRDHQLSVRFDALQITPQQVADNVGEFFQTLQPLLRINAAYVSAKVLTAGLSFTLPGPIPTPALGGLVSTNDPNRQALQVTIPGRSQQGRRNTVSLIGLEIDPPVTWQGNATTVPDLGMTIAFLQGVGPASAAPGAWLAIDGTSTIWYDRITFDYNDYWVRQLRR